MRNQKEIEKALKEYETTPAEDFLKKYGLETMREAEGFVKALKWFLHSEE
jgi:hypothetical protein